MEKSSLALTLYLEWLKEIIQERFAGQKHCSLNDLLALHPEPVLPADCTDTLCRLFYRTKLSPGEKIIFLLSIAPYYIPDFLGKLLPIEGQQQELDPAFSRSAINKNCIPTVATALTILAGENIHQRQESLQLFIAGAALVKNQLIYIARSTPYDPFTTLRLLPGEHAFQYLSTGEEQHPSFSGDFPAVLLETGYSWEDLVLPPETLHQVKEIKEWVEFEKKLKQEEREATKFKPGCKCLFHGPPGVGKPWQRLYWENIPIKKCIKSIFRLLFLNILEKQKRTYLLSLIRQRMVTGSCFSMKQMHFSGNGALQKAPMIATPIRKLLIFYNALKITRACRSWHQTLRIILIRPSFEDFISL